MRKLTFIFLAATLFSCNNGGTDTKDAVKDTATTKAYPYKIEHPDAWEMGNTANTMVVLNSIKAWEDGKLDESIKYFGDSVRAQFDAFDKKLSNDSLKVLLTNERNRYKTVALKMEDWESVVSKDKTQEWVTLWYTQTWETTKGVKDSAAVINDLQLKGGKIIRIDEYLRKLH